MKLRLSTVMTVCLWLFGIGSIGAQDLGPHIKKIADGIYVRAEKPVDSNAAIILTQEGVVMIDSGHTPPDSVALREALKRLTPMPVRYLIDTEPHTDHTTGHWLFSPPPLSSPTRGRPRP
jgi:glyoxylase-like metal-dependent hydrolase (beta-lactamase superfamily II)